MRWHSIWVFNFVTIFPFTNEKKTKKQVSQNDDLIVPWQHKYSKVTNQKKCTLTELAHYMWYYIVLDKEGLSSIGKSVTTVTQKNKNSLETSAKFIMFFFLYFIESQYYFSHPYKNNAIWCILCCCGDIFVRMWYLFFSTETFIFW